MLIMMIISRAHLSCSLASLELSLLVSSSPPEWPPLDQDGRQLGASSAAAQQQQQQLSCAIAGKLLIANKFQLFPSRHGA